MIIIAISFVLPIQKVVYGWNILDSLILYMCESLDLSPIMLLLMNTGKCFSQMNQLHAHVATLYILTSLEFNYEVFCFQEDITYILCYIWYNDADKVSSSIISYLLCLVLFLSFLFCFLFIWVVILYSYHSLPLYSV